MFPDTPPQAGWRRPRQGCSWACSPLRRDGHWLCFFTAVSFGFIRRSGHVHAECVSPSRASGNCSSRGAPGPRLEATLQAWVSFPHPSDADAPVAQLPRLLTLTTEVLTSVCSFFCPPLPTWGTDSCCKPGASAAYSSFQERK